MEKFYFSKGKLLTLLHKIQFSLDTHPNQSPTPRARVPRSHPTCADRSLPRTLRRSSAPAFRQPRLRLWNLPAPPPTTAAAPHPHHDRSLCPFLRRQIAHHRLSRAVAPPTTAPCAALPHALNLAHTSLSLTPYSPFRAARLHIMSPFHLSRTP